MAFTCLQAQRDAWTTFLDSWRQRPHPPATLLISKEQLNSEYRSSDEQLLRLICSWDLALEAHEGPVLEAIREAREWRPGPHWLLLARDGRILDEGGSLPTGDFLRGRLLAAGIQPTWDALDAFLRLHPDNGTALVHRMNIAMLMTRRRFAALQAQGKAEMPRLATGGIFPSISPLKVMDSEAAQAAMAEMEDTLERLVQLPDPWRLSDQMMLDFWIEMYCSSGPMELRRTLRTLGDALMEVWRQNPQAGQFSLEALKERGETLALGTLWQACQRASGAPESVPELPNLTAAPGRIWPHADLVMSVTTRRGDPRQAASLLAFLEGLPQKTPQPPLWEGTWSNWVSYRALVAGWRAICLANLERWPEAVSALQEGRRWAGKTWTESAEDLRNRFTRSEAPPSGGKGEATPRPVAPEAFLEVLRLPPLEEVPAPAALPPLRLLVWGKPEWAGRWEAIRSTAPLAPWSAGELRREAPSSADTARLARAGFPERGWAVFRGDAEILAQGEDAPDPVQLALRLQASAPSRIHLLDAFIAKHTDHLDARRDRFTLVKARMPQATLEARLMEDAAKVHLPLDFGPTAPWIAHLEGWRFQARKVVAELDEALHRWPDNGALWRAWISWSAFLPKPPSVVEYASGLPVFGLRESWRARLPAVVHRAVAREFSASRRFEAMLDWFGGAWSHRVAANSWFYPSYLKEPPKAIYEGYRGALTALGRLADRTSLDKEWREIQAKEGEPPPP
jgi:hypothetical protein